MHQTKIEWVFNPDGSRPGWVWNPITGCLNGCSYCFARRLANGRLQSRYLANSILPCHDEQDHDKHQRDPFYPRFWPTKLEDIYRPKLSKAKARGIFVCDMSDLFGTGIPEDWTRQVIDAIKANIVDRFYLLTKQPQNLPKWSPFPLNCWVGVSATNTRMAFEGAVALGNIESPVRFLSIEPMLNSIYLPSAFLKQCGIGWLILGSQTGPVRHPKPEWVQGIIATADKAGVPVFVKSPLSEYMRIYRQEFPKSCQRWPCLEEAKEEHVCQMLEEVMYP